MHIYSVTILAHPQLLFHCIKTSTIYYETLLGKNVCFRYLNNVSENISLSRNISRHPLEMYVQKWKWYTYYVSIILSHNFRKSNCVQIFPNIRIIHESPFCRSRAFASEHTESRQAGMTKLSGAIRHLCLAKNLEYTDQVQRKRTKVYIYVQ